VGFSLAFFSNTREPSNIRNFNVRVTTAELSLSDLWSVMSELNYRPELSVMRLKLFCLCMTCRTDAMILWQCRPADNNKQKTHTIIWTITVIWHDLTRNGTDWYKEWHLAVSEEKSDRRVMTTCFFSTRWKVQVKKSQKFLKMWITTA